MIPQHCINGVAVIVSPLMPDWFEGPVRKHRGAGKTAYSRRVQKKWDKRFGVERTVAFMHDLQANRFFCSPAAFEILKRELTR